MRRTWRASRTVRVPGYPLTEVVLETADVMKTYQEMKARGVVFAREPFAATTDGARILYAAYFKDPDGHTLHYWMDQAVVMSRQPADLKVCTT